MSPPHTVFLTGGTGYLGQPLISRLLERGHHVRALVRPSSAHRLPAGCEVVLGDALDGTSFVAAIEPADTFVQLVGVPHPSPAKARQFRDIDLISAKASATAAATAGIEHFVYLSVARPAPVMKVYQQTRAEAEAAILQAGLAATFLRPWYVLGPGHRWPLVLQPFYWLGEGLPWFRADARRLGLVTLDEMVAALVAAVEDPCQGHQVVEVPEIRRAPSRLAVLTAPFCQ